MTDRSLTTPAGTFPRPERVLAIYAHPDDTEVACGGVLAAWAALGTEVHIVIATRGEKGAARADTDPEVLAAQRADEVGAAAQTLGAASHEILGYPDGEVENSVELRGALVERIRRHRPEIVFGHDPVAVYFGHGYVSHHDHRAVGWATLDSCAPAAGSPLYFPEAGQPHPVDGILLSGTLEPDTFVDIEGWLASKIDALLCHATQVGSDRETMAGVVEQRAREAGRQAGLGYAEAFKALRFV
jgi:LmbE family N-acetylglucosaminyl deacetylase